MCRQARKEDFADEVFKTFGELERDSDKSCRERVHTSSHKIVWKDMEEASAREVG